MVSKIQNESRKKVRTCLCVGRGEFKGRDGGEERKRATNALAGDRIKSQKNASLP